MFQLLLANPRTLCPQQKCVIMQENVTKRGIANKYTVLAVICDQGCQKTRNCTIEA